MNKTTRDMSDKMKNIFRTMSGFGKLMRCALLSVMMFAALPARAQQNYVFYNSTYGYLYNDNGTLKSSATLQYDKSSVWVASGTIGTTSRTIQSYTDNQYLGNAGSLSGTTANWRGYNNYLAYRSGGTNYYLKATSATAFTTNNNANNGQRYNYYTVTLTDYPEQLSDISINSGVDAITATGNYSYGHSTTTYRPAYVNYYFSSTNHYVLSDNTQNGTTAPATTAVNTGYTWSLSNADGYATVNSATGEITVSTLPDVDREMVLTCSVSSHGLTKTATKNIKLRGTHPIEPTITRSGNDITIATPSNGATIYYTLDGTEPTASSNVYTAPFNVFGETYPLTIKAVAIRTGNASSVASATYTDPNSGVGGGTVILNDYEPHSWSYYGDPDCPIHSLNPADVKITYYGDGIVMSNNNDYTAGTSNYVSPGDANYVGGAKVNVGGEDENTFVYYKTLERTDGSTSANPTGRCLYTTIPNPFQVRPTYGSRGTTDQNTFTGWRGFQCWRLKSVSGGSVYSAATGGTALATGVIINGETDIYFAPSNEYGMEVELEAVWARAYVVKGDQGGANNILSQNVGVERNFLILTAGQNYRFDGTNGRYIGNKGYAATISRYYPNGETGNTSATVSGYNNMTLEADTKFENVTFNSMGSYTLTAANNDLIIGRGCTGTVNYVRGASGNVTGLNYTLRLESGTYNYISLIKGYMTGSNDYTDNGSTMSGNLDLRCTLGCDYDRATNSGITNNLTVTNNIIVGYSNTVNNANKQRETTNLTIKSGKIGTSVNINANDSYIADAYQSIYVSVAGSHTYIGRRCVRIEGGELIGIAGGIDAYYLGTGTSGNNVTGITRIDQPSVELRMTGGHVRGAIYGGAAKSPGSGNRRMVFTGGTINGWIGCGCNGTEDAGGKTYGESFLYFGGNTRCEADPDHDYTMNGAKGGYVFGAGKGYPSTTGTSGEMTYGTNFAIADNSYIQRDAFGGGNYGYALEYTNLYVSGGTVGGNVFGGSNLKNGPVVNIKMVGGLVESGLYGGSNATGTISGNVTMQIDGGQVGTSSNNANIHGGGYGSATVVSGNVDLTLGTTTQTTSGVTVYGDVYGGSALGTVNTNASNHTNVTMNKGIINGSLYGGALGSNTIAANVNGPVTVTVNGGSVNTTTANGSGAVYGCNNLNGAPQSTVAVIINGTDPAPNVNAYALDAVYGGGNLASYAAGTPTVTVNNCNNSIAYVYGGGNAAHITNGNTDVTIYGGNKIGNVFGGGNGTVQAANVSGNTNVKIHGGTIGRVFGGSNTQGNIGGTINVNVTKNSTCEMHIDEVYGGGNLAPSNAGNVSIGCTGGSGEGIGDLYGGANQANISGDINLSISGGSINRVFGGNNVTGSISGGIGVTVNWETSNSCGYNYIGEVFGGGNLAQYTIPNNKTLTVNILNGTVSGNVYGGGKGDPGDHTKGQVTGNPVVTIGDSASGHEAYVATVGGDVYGGGDAGNVVGTPQVNIVNKCNTTIANVYGGGNAADVNGTDVNIDGGNITGMVFGGGHGDKNSTPQKQADVKGNVAVDVTGGTINKVFGGSNSKGNITGTVSVNIAKGNNSCDMHITEVYGGGNEAAGNAGTITIGCTGDYTNNSEGITNVYGGANAADIGNNISLTIRGGHIDNVYGGNNASGNISGTIAVNVNWDNALTCDKYLGNVFGGGNLAAYTGSPTVTLTNGIVSHSVYGGGNEAGVGGSTVNINGGQVVDGVYGGCNTSGTVTGAIAVNINGGTLGTNSNNMTNGIFGGGYGSSTATEGNVTVTIGDVEGAKTPIIYGDIYGGSALGNVNNESTDITTVNFLNGTLHGNLYGGGLGDATHAAKVNGQVIVNVSNTTQTAAQCKIDLRDATIYGCNNTNGSPQDAVNVNIYKTAYNYSDYNSGDNYTAANGTDPYYAIDQVFGGGNQADYAPENGAANSQKKAVVHIYGCDNTVRRVFGGGNAAAATGIQTIIEGGRYDYVFGGGNGENQAANIGAGGTDLQVHGGDIRDLFGGSNASGTITGQMRVLVDAEGACGSNMNIHEFFCGNNLANIGTQQNPSNIVATIGCGTRFGDVYGGCNLAEIYGNVTLTVEGGTMNNVYGGSKGDLASLGTGHTNQAADIHGDVTLNIIGGSITNAFGGSNVNGNITGTITVNVEKSANPCVWSLTNVYGGSNLAAYTPTTPGAYPAVNIKNGNVTGNVFGGGLGSSATVTSNPVVTVGDNTSGHEAYVATVGENVFGGGNAAPVNGTTKVTVQNKARVSGNVFGGGNAAAVSSNTEVQLKDRARVYGNVYGGGNQGEVGGNTKVIVNGVTVSE